MIRHPTNYDTVPGLTPILYTSMAIDQIGSQLDVSKIQPKVSLSAHGQQTTKILVYPTNWVPQTSELRIKLPFLGYPGNFPHFQIHPYQSLIPRGYNSGHWFWVGHFDTLVICRSFHWIGQCSVSSLLSLRICPSTWREKSRMFPLGGE